MSRHIVKDYVSRKAKKTYNLSRKAKMTYNLEWREYNFLTDALRKIPLNLLLPFSELLIILQGSQEVYPDIVFISFVREHVFCTEHLLSRQDAITFCSSGFTNISPDGVLLRLSGGKLSLRASSGGTFKIK